MLSVRKATLALALAGALGAAGCGSSGGGTLSKDDFVKQADEICGKAAKDVEALGRPDTPDKIATAMPKAAGIFNSMLDELAKLKGPSDIQPDVDKLLAAGHKLADVMGQLGDAAKSTDVTKLTQLQTDLTTAATDAAAASKKLGFANCGVS